MSRRWWLVGAGLVVFMLIALALALLPWQWHGQLQTPAGAANQNVVFQCGAPWGADSIQGPPSTAYPVVGQPCDTRDQYRIMPVVDLILGVIGIAVVARLGRARMAERTA